MTRDMTCIICPVGCSLKAELDDDGKFISVSGNTCPRGAKYAEDECTNPMRTVTTTVRCEGGAVLPVKTATPIPKDKVLECMRLISKHITHLPKSAGDVIIDDIFGSSIVATADMSEK